MSRCSPRRTEPRSEAAHSAAVVAAHRHHRDGRAGCRGRPRTHRVRRLGAAGDAAGVRPRPALDAVVQLGSGDDGDPRGGRGGRTAAQAVAAGRGGGAVPGALGDRDPAAQTVVRPLQGRGAGLPERAHHRRHHGDGDAGARRRLPGVADGHRRRGHLDRRVEHGGHRPALSDRQHRCGVPGVRGGLPGGAGRGSSGGFAGGGPARRAARDHAAAQEWARRGPVAGHAAAPETGGLPGGVQPVEHRSVALEYP